VRLRLPRSRSARIALALIIATEIRGLIVVAWALWAAGGLPGLVAAAGLPVSH
jgi:hypothetical protein